MGRPPGSGIPAWAVRQSSSASASGRLGGKTTEVRRLLDLAKPEKYRIIGNEKSMSEMFIVRVVYNVF